MNNTIYKHRPTTPDWLYQRANLNLDVLPEIKKELLQIFEFSKQSCLVPYTSTFMGLNADQVKNCPMLFQELDRLKLKETFEFLAFISVVSDQEFPAHVDGGDGDIGLNIPLLNCSGTYTVWYNGNIKVAGKKFPEHVIGAQIVENARPGDPEGLVEIDRIEADIPYWINVNVLHCPVTTHNNFRVAASLRFAPDPLDEHGQLWPHLIK